MNSNNFCIIMAGGTSSRFWPLCNANHAKQFIDIMGTGETMLQSTFRHYSAVCEKSHIIIVTTAAMRNQVQRQLPGLKPYQILCEPQRRNTAPCVAFAAAVIRRINPNANIIVSPSDHAIFNEKAFEHDLAKALSAAACHDWIVTLGAAPTNPTTEYGYMQYELSAAATDALKFHKVITFTEKPPLEMARQFIASGEFLWNTGIYVWRLPVLLEAFREHLPAIAESYAALDFDTPQEQLERVYETSDTISLDYGIMEKAQNVYCLPASFGWSDVETWESLYGVLSKDDSGNAYASGKTLFYDSHNTLVHVPEDMVAIVDGLDDYLVSTSNGVLLIAPREHSNMLIRFAGDVAVAESKPLK